MSQDKQIEGQEETPPISFAEFLEKIPPSTMRSIHDLTIRIIDYGPVQWKLKTPEIQLHCTNEACNGTRFFRCISHQIPRITDEKFRYCYITYQCSNCQSSTKVFSIAAMRDLGSEAGKCHKLGEFPTYGPPTPPRLISLIGPDRDLFLKGRRCENQGLGIGAFAYYRRVIENQKDRILDKIINVSKKLNVAKDIIQILESAKRETQFTKAFASVNNSIPESLLINGHNPLTLLHSALSSGLHEQSDERCLEIASSVRIVLGELSERIAQALKDEAELKNALSKLMSLNKKGEKASQ